jgi:hypothetical protein
MNPPNYLAALDAAPVLQFRIGPQWRGTSERKRYVAISRLYAC